MVKLKDGQYYYEPHRRMWGIWQYHQLSDGYSYGSFIKDVTTRDEAKQEVYRLNNWN